MQPKKIAKVFQEFGKKRVDNYFWMRDKKDPDVLSYINFENKQTDEYFKDTKTFQEKLFKELKSRKKEQESSVPYFYNEYWYLKKFEKGKEYPILFRRKGSMRGKWEKIFDQNELAKGKKYFQIGTASISPDNRYAAYAEDTTADKRYTIKIKDLMTGKHLSDRLVDVSASLEWTNDSRSVVYVEHDPVTLRPCRIKQHVLGTSQKSDMLVFEEKNETYYIDIHKSRSKQYLIIGVGSHDHEFAYVMDASGGNLTPKLFVSPKTGTIYDVNHGGEHWYIRTNERTVDFEVFKVSDTNPSRKYWVQYLPAQSGKRYTSLLLFKDYLVYELVVAGIPEIYVINLHSGKKHRIAFSEKLYSTDFLANPEYDMNTLRISYETMKDPIVEYEYAMDKGTRRVLKVHTPKGRYDARRYVTKRVWVKGHDGMKIPLSLLYKKDLPMNGTNPCLLYGYGSYGHTLYPEFNENLFSLVDRGFVYAVAHIRGGQEMGRRWYLDGKFLKKKNTFHDFISCAEFLVKKKYTQKEKLFARGGSAGGLLMGAVANMRPDLFAGMVFQVPFVDVMNTMLDASIPLTTAEYVEWGNPNEKKYHHYMLSYSPYDNIVKQKYPTIFIDSGFHDTQVHYWEPLKYIAKMKEVNPTTKIYLNMDLDTGHGGKSGRFSHLHDLARVYTFLLKEVGIKR